MAKPEQPSRDSQMRKFKEAARELGCKNSEEAFDEALKKVAKAPREKNLAEPRRKAKSK